MKCERCNAKEGEITVWWKILPADNEEWDKELLFEFNVLVCLDCASGVFFPEESLWAIHSKIHPNPLG